jgi:hypothetical protein
MRRAQSIAYTEDTMKMTLRISLLALLGLAATACGQDTSLESGSTTSESALIPDQEPGGPDEKITICHATHSEKNPYVEITISVNALGAHKDHQDYEDIIPAPYRGCPKVVECDCSWTK